MLLDWDKLSETELKRLVSQLEKTRNDLRYVQTSIFREFFLFQTTLQNSTEIQKHNLNVSKQNFS